MNPDPNQPLTFMGMFNRDVDQKGRVTIPSEWRLLLEGEKYIIVTDSTDTHLHVMPPAEFEKVAHNAENNPNFTPAMKTVFLQNLYSRATSVATDKQGRLLLPETRLRLGMKEEAVMVGVKGWFKLFSKDAWTAAREQQAADFREMGQALGI